MYLMCVCVCVNYKYDINYAYVFYIVLFLLSFFCKNCMTLILYYIIMYLMCEL